MTKALIPSRTTRANAPLAVPRRGPAISALALAVALPFATALGAQEVPLAGMSEREAARQLSRQATIHVEILARGHDRTWDALRRASLVWTGSTTELPPLVTHLLANAHLAAYTGDDLPYHPDVGLEWGLRQRLCEDPDQPGTWHLLSWIDPALGFKRGFSPREMQAQPGFYYALEGREQPSDTKVGLLQGPPVSTYSNFAGAVSPLPACVGAPWPDGSRLPGAETIALYTSGRLRNLMPRFYSEWEEREIACPPASDPSLTIGLATELRETRQPVDMRGRPLVMADGTPAAAVVGDWTYKRGCRAQKRRTLQMLEECTYISQGLTFPGRRVWLYEAIETVPAAPYERGVAGQEAYVPLTGVAPRLVSDGCGGGSVAPRIAVTPTSYTLSEDHACRAIYPVPPVHAHIPYDRGLWSRVRTRTDHAVSFPAGAGVADYIAATYTPWQVSRDDCHRVYQQTYPDSEVLSCPAGFTGSITQARNRIVTTTDYARADLSDSASTSYSSWTTVSNSCKKSPPPCYFAGGWEKGDGNPCGNTGSGAAFGNGGKERQTNFEAANGEVYGSQEEADTYGGGFTGMVDQEVTSRGSKSVQGGANFGKQTAAGGNTDNSDSEGKDCYLTTAVVELRGEADNGPTLSRLRGFRDGYLRAHPDGAALIAEYYRDAPRIVAAIPQGHSDWAWIAGEVDAACRAIEAGADAKAFAIYTAMVRRLQAAWL